MTAALNPQQLRDDLRQFLGDVERGTMGDHAEPSGEGDLVETLLLGSTPPSPGSRFVCDSARMPLPGHGKPGCPNLFR